MIFDKVVNMDEYENTTLTIQMGRHKTEYRVSTAHISANRSHYVERLKGDG